MKKPERRNPGVEDRRSRPPPPPAEIVRGPSTALRKASAPRRMTGWGLEPGNEVGQMVRHRRDRRRLIHEDKFIRGEQDFRECAPCHWMNDAFHTGTEARLQGHGGLRAKILSDGVLRVGE